MKRVFPIFSLGMMAIALFGQRLALNLAGMQIGISFLVFCAFILVGVLSQQVLIQKERLLLFLGAVLGLLMAALSASNSSQYFSTQSLVLLLLLYFLSVFVFQDDLREIILNGFQTLVFVIAILGVLQFVTQLAGIPYRDWLSFIPSQNIIGNYNYNIPLEFGSHLYKANGIFLQEPSTFSQLVAVSILLEMYLFKKYTRLILWLAALLVSFSGTGLTLLGIGILPLVFKLEIKKIVIFSGIVGLAALIFAYSGFASYTVNRVGEFDNAGKSGYIRFIAPYVTYLDFLKEPGTTVSEVFGLGPGASDRYEWDTTAHFNPPMKLIIEYGLFGLLFYLYLMYIFFSRQPFWLSFALFIMYTFLSGSLLTYQTTILFFLLLTLHREHEIVPEFALDPAGAS